MAKALADDLKYLRHEFVVAAVLEAVRFNNEEAHVFQGFNAPDLAWLRHSTMRQDLFGRVRDTWCQKTGKDFTFFPYSEDYVVRLYSKFKNGTEAQLAGWAKEIKKGLKA